MFESFLKSSQISIFQNGSDFLNQELDIKEGGKKYDYETTSDNILKIMKNNRNQKDLDGELLFQNLQMLNQNDMGRQVISMLAKHKVKITNQRKDMGDLKGIYTQTLQGHEIHLNIHNQEGKVDSEALFRLPISLVHEPVHLVQNINEQRHKLPDELELLKLNKKDYLSYKYIREADAFSRNTEFAYLNKDLWQSYKEGYQEIALSYEKAKDKGLSNDDCYKATFEAFFKSDKIPKYDKLYGDYYDYMTKGKEGTKSYDLNKASQIITIGRYDKDIYNLVKPKLLLHSNQKGR
ncbi:MAG: hypothetical protein BWY78_00411 [Alphaproteobacteria bacterium ADurb.Bin438]|nr:MAG: hypothetical protein BWY78_00411 [Alphaproteobacteria bacterium ADurb.Bin438]